MGIKQPGCETKGCCWRPLENGSKAPWCFFPAAKGIITYLTKIDSVYNNKSIENYR